MKRHLVLGFLATSITLSACAVTGEGGMQTKINNSTPIDLTVYSPAPAKIMMHEHNVAAANLLEGCASFGRVDAPAVALPKSINDINMLQAGEKPFHLPIMTTLDFKTAIDDTAPDWHGYSRKNPDLKFVGSLYEVAYGIMVFDDSIAAPDDLRGSRIAVPARPSAVRWFSEALLSEGWGISDDVTLVPLIPPQVPEALANNEIDAVAWNIMSETPEGFRPLLPMLFANENARWLNVDEVTLNKINAASSFTTAIVDIAAGEILAGENTNKTPVKLLSFKQGLAAWSSTPDRVVKDIVTCLAAGKRSFGAAGSYVDQQFDWPGLEAQDIHPGAK